MSTRVTHQIERGMHLKEQALALASCWQFDPATDRFPDFIVGDSHVLGELEIDIERWFNEVWVLTDGLIGGGHRTLFYMYLNDISGPGRSFRQIPTRTEYLQNVRDAFDFAIRELNKIPFMGDDPARTEARPSSVPISPNTAFILMWMDPAKPYLQDVANAFKEVCAKFGIQARRADDVEHQDVITTLSWITSDSRSSCSPILRARDQTYTTKSDMLTQSVSVRFFTGAWEPLSTLTSPSTMFRSIRTSRS